MTMTTKTLTHSALALAAMVLAGTATAAEVNWDLSNDYQASSIPGQADQIFADRVQELSDGTVDVTLHPGGALGYKSQDVFDAVQNGAVQIGNASTVFWGGIHPIFKLSGLPFLVAGPEDAKALFDIARPEYEQVLQDNNQVLLYSAPWPPSGIWARRPVDSPDAVIDLKIRTYDTNSTMTFRELGASPVQLSWGDVVPQLAADAIEAVLTSAEGGANAKFWEHLDHFTEINYAMPLSMATLNLDAFESLTTNQQEAVRDAAREAEEAAWGALAERTAHNYDMMQENGVTLTTDLPQDYLGTLNEGGEPARKAWLEEIGDSGRQILEAYEDR